MEKVLSRDGTPIAFDKVGEGPPLTRLHKAFSETDFTEDLKKFDVPTLVLHGDDDQIVPIGAAGLASAKLIKGSTLKVYPGAPHGLTDTRKDRLNADLLAFIAA